MKKIFYILHESLPAPACRTGRGRQGFTIFFAMLVGSLSLAIGLAIYDLTIRELDLSATATQSQYAIYAADAGVECALYWDSKCSLANCRSGSVFATSTDFIAPGSGVMCNGQDISTAWSVNRAGGVYATTTFSFNFLPQANCATVEVVKSYAIPTLTTIISHGFNTCTSGAPLRLERTFRVGY